MFAIMPGGAWIAIAFFFLLSAAALTSAVSLLEVPVAIAGRLGVSRASAAVAIALCAFLAGVPSALGSGPWREVSLAGRQILEAVDFLAADLLLPVVGILVTLFAGWVLPRDEALRHCGLPRPLAHAWHAALRYLAPAAMLVTLITLAFD